MKKIILTSIVLVLLFSINITYTKEKKTRSFCGIYINSNNQIFETFDGGLTVNIAEYNPEYVKELTNNFAKTKTEITNEVFSIYPIPCKDQITLKLDNKETGQLKIFGYNELLQEIELMNTYKTTEQNTFEIDISKLQKGFLFFKIELNGNIYNAKCIKH